jgi:hypothetical protein
MVISNTRGGPPLVLLQLRVEQPAAAGAGSATMMTQASAGAPVQGLWSGKVAVEHRAAQNKHCHQLELACHRQVKC